jgi:acetyl-CoA carboxylase biotin carboxyl carrier protein
MTQKGASFDKDLIRELASLLEETGLTEIEVEHDGKRIRVARGVNLTTTLTTTGDVPASEPREAPRPGKRGSSQADEFVVHPGTVTSPMVGTAYRCPSQAPRPSSRLALRWPPAKRSSSSKP